jgi:hypothetical protein
MDEVKRKVLLDLFASPGTLLPIAGGLTLLMASWATGGNAVFNFGGIAGILGGVGVFATRMIVGLEGLTDRAYQYVLQKQRRQQQQRLAELDAQLSNDDDPRTETCLRSLRELYDAFRQDVQQGKITGASYDVLDGVDRLFHVCVSNLEHSHDLWQAAGRLSGSTRDTVLAERDEVIREVQETVDYLRHTMERWHALGVKKKKSELTQLRTELDESLRVARRTDERIAELEGNAAYQDHERKPK